MDIEPPITVVLSKATPPWLIISFTGLIGIIKFNFLKILGTSKDWITLVIINNPLRTSCTTNCRIIVKETFLKANAKSTIMELMKIYCRHPANNSFKTRRNCPTSKEVPYPNNKLPKSRLLKAYINTRITLYVAPLIKEDNKIFLLLWPDIILFLNVPDEKSEQIMIDVKIGIITPTLFV